MSEPGRWTGVDLDGVLALVDMDKPYDGSIGPPNPHVVPVVRKWLEAGRDVRVFTARVAAPLQRWDGYDYPCDSYAIRFQRRLIREWTAEHLGQALEATATKDFLCDAIYDDRAFHVFRNGGIYVGYPPEPLVAEVSP